MTGAEWHSLSLVLVGLWALIKKGSILHAAILAFRAFLDPYETL
jgi:hypothetical protein